MTEPNSSHEMKIEPSSSNEMRIEPSSFEPAKTEPTKTEPIKTELSFSQQVKDELVSLTVASDEETNLWLAVALVASGEFRAGEISIKSAQQAFIEKIQAEAERLWGAKGAFGRKKAYSYLRFTDEMSVHRVRRELLDVLQYNASRGMLNRKAVTFTRPLRLVALAALFLASGSMADPARSYQIEFSLRRQSVMTFLEDLLDMEEIETIRQHQGAYHMLYIKNGDHIADLLGGIGAHRSLLHYEDTRVRKNMNEMVNRAVNCDNANLQRVADTSARQIELLRDVEEIGGLADLPENLQQAATLRLENPGLSIRELGEVMDPPLGKSGMFHRLGKLETWAKQYLEAKRGT